MPTIIMQDEELLDAQALCAWIEKLSNMVERQHESLQIVSRRVKTASLVTKALRMVAHGKQAGQESDVVSRMLTTVKIIMRDRRGIDELLTVETLQLFLTLAESADAQVAEEALKCVINSVYSRPHFVRDYALPGGFALRLLKISERPAPASMHLMVWKALLVSCEASEFIIALAHNVEVWKRIHSTLHFCLFACHEPFPSGSDRASLFTELVKLIAVLMNDIQLAAPTSTSLRPPVDPAKLVEILQPLGEVLLHSLRYSPPHLSPFDPELVDIKNKVMEIFMFVPKELLAFFVAQQHDALSVLLDHLYSMLVLVRIEKTRMTKDLQPVLVACHHLTSTGDPTVKNFFRSRIFPDGTADPSSPQLRHPAPPAFFHKHLTFFLTSIDTTIKRYTGEWLYLLCDQNADEFTRKTGLGNAIGLLRIKGLA